MSAATFVRYHSLVRITLAYIAGIGITSFCFRFSICMLLFCGVFLTALSGLLILWKNTSMRYFFQGMLIYVVFVFAGSYNCRLFQRHHEVPDEFVRYRGIVISSSVIKDRSIQLDCNIVSMVFHDQNIVFHEKVRLYLEPDSMQIITDIGDSVFFQGRLTKIQNPGNPGEFNYARYMEIQGIYFSGFISRADYHFGEYSGKLKIRRFSAHLQQKLIALFRKNNIRNDELAVLSALIAGNRDYLEQEIQQYYIAIGAMHILSVSGLHVGILYLILASLFGNWSTSRYYKLFRTLIILAAIWMYAFITGLSSPVQRAAFMFSLLLIGKNIQRQANNYNILAASALLILLINPLELFKVGFQFSYLAVLGIIYFQPKLEQLLFIRNNLIDRIWQLFTVSIAAQLTTFPLSLYYFHQFPVYFWFANIIIIPLVWLIMVGAVIFCILIPVGSVLPYLAILLNILLKLLNHIVRFISELPLATISEIRFGIFDLIASSFCIIFFMIQISRKRFRQIPYLIGLCIIFIITADLISFYKTLHRKEFIIYTTRNNAFVISHIDGNNQTIITKGINSIEDDATIHYLKNYWITRNINRNIHWIPVENEIPGKQIKGQNLLITFVPNGFISKFYNTQYMYFKKSARDTSSNYRPSGEKIMLIDTDSGYPDREVYEKYLPDIILAGNSMPRYRKELWKDFANKYGIIFYDLSTEGAFHKKTTFQYNKSTKK